MPIAHKTYGCVFKCGCRHRESFKEMENHEKQCWRNPEVKSCVTCEHGIVKYHSKPDDRFGTVLSDPYRVCGHDNQVTFAGYKPIVNCPNHWIREEHE